jgi:hypothetical protein
LDGDVEQRLAEGGTGTSKDVVLIRSLLDEMVGGGEDSLY